jgi:hypothetical protein
VKYWRADVTVMPAMRMRAKIVLAVRVELTAHNHILAQREIQAVSGRL